MSKEKVISVCKVASYVAIDDIEIHPSNPRTISRERLDTLKSSIVKKGFYEPILMWTHKPHPLSGNHRVKAVRELIDEGWEFTTGGARPKKNMLPVVFEDCEEDVAIQILFETNNQYAEWIDEKVREALSEADAVGSELRDFGFTPDELNKYLVRVNKEAEDVLDNLKDEKKETIPESDSEEQKVLVLPESIYTKLMSIFKNLAWQVDEGWKDGDSLNPAISAFCDFCLENGIPDITAEVDEE